MSEREIVDSQSEKSDEDSSSTTVETKSKRANIISELLLTEATYGQFLNTLQNEFYFPLLELSTTQTPILTRKELDLVFQNLSKILFIQSLLFDKIKKRLSQPDFSYDDSAFTDIFLEIFEDKSVSIQEEYQNYINNYDKSLSSLVEIQKRNSKFRKFSSHILENKNNNFANIQSYLIAPVQRLPRYVLMLTDLKRNTSEDKEDYRFVSKALEKVLETTQNINSGKQFYEDMLCKEVLFKKFSKTDQITLEKTINPHDLIITEGPLLLETRSRKYNTRIIIITTNSIIISKKRGNNELKICNLLSILSCSVQFDDDNSIINLISLDRIDSPPFITKSIYNFKTSENEEFDWDFWENILKKSLQQTMNAAALMNRASETKSHLQLVLLTNEHWNKLLEESSSFKISSKTNVLDESSTSCLYIIKSGYIDAIKEINGKPKVISSLRDNDIIGETNFLRSLKTGKSHSYSANYISQCKSEIQKIPHKSIISILNENDEIAWRFYFLIGAIIGEKLIRINAILSKTVTMEDAVNIKSKRANSVVLQKSASHLLSAKRASTSISQESETSKKYIGIQKDIKEPILIEYSCKFKTQSKGSNVSGILLFSSNHFILYRKVFGKKTQFIVPSIAIKKLNNATPDSKLVVIEYCLPDSDIIDEIQLTLHSKDSNDIIKALNNLISTKKNSSMSTWDSSSQLDVLNTKELEIFEKETSFEKHDIIVQAGVLSDCVYQLTSGRCRVEIENSIGKRQVVGQIRRGETFGELSFLLGTVTGAYVIADSSNTSVVTCSWSNLTTLTSLNLKIASNFYQNLAQVLSKRFLSAERKVLNPTQTVNKSKSSKIAKKKIKSKG